METTLVKTFENSDFGRVRVVMIDGEAWFVAKDVCECLTISKYRDAIANLDDDERASIKVDTLGGQQKMTAVNEFGLYNLIFSSRKKEAKQFKRWVTHEVLPSIRKTGAYIQPEKVEESTDGYVPKFFSGMKVFTLRDASTLLKVRYEYLRQLLRKPQKANLEEGRDYLKLVGGLLKGFIHENSSVPSNLPSLILLFESGFNKICEYFKMKVSSIFSSDSGEITLNFEEKKEQAKTYFYDGANRAKEKIKDYLKVQEFLIEEHERLTASLKSLQPDEPLVHSLKDLKNVISYIGIRIVTESCELEPISK